MFNLDHLIQLSKSNEVSCLQASAIGITCSLKKATELAREEMTFRENDQFLFAYTCSYMYVLFCTAQCNMTVLSRILQFNNVMLSVETYFSLK